MSAPALIFLAAVRRRPLSLRAGWGYSAGVRVSEVEVRRLAERIVAAAVKQGDLRAKADVGVLNQRVAGLILENMQQEAALEEEAERMADTHARRMAGMDQRRVVQLIKQKLAEERGFSL